MKRKKKDHGFIEVKWLMRKGLLEEVRPRVALDLFAGEGVLARSLYCGFKRVHAVEKDPAKARRLELKARQAGLHMIEVHTMDNREFIKNVLPGLSGVTMVDFDAYGNPLPAVKDFFNAWRPWTRTAVAVTDGGRLSISRGCAINMQSYLAGQARGQDLPAGARLKTRPFSPLEYQLMVRAFWQELARIHGFNIMDFVSAWKKGKGVLYYGIVIEPR